MLNVRIQFVSAHEKEKKRQWSPKYLRGSRFTSVLSCFWLAARHLNCDRTHSGIIRLVQMVTPGNVHLDSVHQLGVEVVMVRLFTI